jgi:hypothetical protein
LAATVAAMLAQTAVFWALLAVCAAQLAMLAGWTRRPWSLAWVAVLLLAVVNSVKWPDSDLAEYYGYLDHAGQTGFWALVLDPETYLSIKVTEPLFRIFAWCISHASPAPRVTFTLLSTIFIYGTALFLCNKAMNWLLPPAQPGAQDADPTPMIASCVALLIGLTFSLTGHLVRQYLAGGLFMVGVFGLATDRRSIWLLGPVLSVATHNSAILLWIPLIFSWLYGYSPRSCWLGLLLMVGLANSGLFSFLNDLIEVGKLLQDDGQIGPALPALDVVVLLAGWYLLRREAGAPQRNLLWVYAVAFAALLMTIREVPLMFFRTYFYVEFLRTPLLAMLLVAGLRRCGPWKAPVAALAIVLSLGLCWLRAEGSEWLYQGAAASQPEWWQMSRLMDRWERIESLRL